MLSKEASLVLIALIWVASIVVAIYPHRILAIGLAIAVTVYLVVAIIDYIDGIRSQGRGVM